MSSTSGHATTQRRRRTNPRGQGKRLREDLIDAAIAMIESDPPEALTLRGLARRVGVAATSVYLHFPDIDHVCAVVVEHAFAQLTQTGSEAVAGITDPAEALLARCLAYCRFGLAHPNLYRVMFDTAIPVRALAAGPAATPGRRSFDNLVAAVSRCIDEGHALPHDDPFRLATLIWTAEHGLVLGLISRPTFPWAPIEELVEELVTRMMNLQTPITPAPLPRRT